MFKIFYAGAVLLVLLAACNKKSFSETLPKGVQKLQTEHRLSDPEKIEVLEFLWLGCSFCRKFHKNWVSLKKQLGDKVAFRAVPATFENWLFDARVYVSLKELGLMNDGLLANYYEARQGPQKAELSQDVQAVARWLEQRYGTPAQDFLDIFGSSLVDDKLDEWGELIAKYPIDSVPIVLLSVPQRKESYLIHYTQGAATEKTILDLVKSSSSP
ncbi:MAG: hypothetical protein AAF975_02865 [Spirochaetota bacterium]